MEDNIQNLSGLVSSNFTGSIPDTNPTPNNNQLNNATEVLVTEQVLDVDLTNSIVESDNKVEEIVEEKVTVENNNTNIEPEVEVNNYENPIAEFTSNKPKLKVRAASLIAAMANVQLVAKNDPKLNITSVIQLKFTSNGVYVIGNDLSNVIKVFIPKDDVQECSIDMSIGVEAGRLSALVAKMNTEGVVLFDLNEENHYVTIEYEKNGVLKGRWILREKFDISSGQSINLLTYDEYDNIPMTGVDFGKLKTKLKTIESYQVPDQNNEYYGSTYFDEDMIFITDKNNFAIQKSVDGLRGTELLVPNDYIKLLFTVNLKGGVGFGYISDNETKRNKTLIVRDCLQFNESNLGSATIANIKELGVQTTIIGTLSFERDFDTFKNYALAAYKNIENSDFEFQVVLNRVQLIESINRANVFLGKDDRNGCFFEIKKGSLIISTLDGTAKEIIYNPLTDYNTEKINQIKDNYEVEGSTRRAVTLSSKETILNTDIKPFKLDTVRFLLALNDYSDSDIIFKVDPKITNCIEVVCGDKNSITSVRVITSTMD